MALIKGSFDPANSPDTNMMDMGWVSDTIVETESTEVSSNKEKIYPSVYLDHIPEGLLANIKAGEMVKFNIIGKIKRIIAESKDGKTEVSTCLEIHSMSQFKSNI